jgi:hypothetical protein
LDGSGPSETSTLYAGPLQLAATTTVKAQAFRTAMSPSPVSVATFLRSDDFSPASLPGLALWTRNDAGIEADAAGRVSAWRDQSGNANDLTQTALDAQPTLVQGAQNGLPVLRFDGAADWMPFTTRLNGTIRAVFAVLKESGAPAYRAILGDASTKDFSPGQVTLWYGDASPSILQGQTWLNGVPVDGQTTHRPTTMSVLSVVPTAGVTADRLFQQPGWASYWQGDIAELVIYTQPLTASQRKSVEDYLTLKYAAYVGAAGAPEFTPNGGSFGATVSVSLQTPTPGAEIHYTIDGSDPTATSTLYGGSFALTSTTTVKARAFRADMSPSPLSVATFLRSGDFSPASVPGLALWTRNDAGIEADAAGRVAAWRDQSGNANDLTQTALAAQPTLVPGAQNGLPVLRFDGANDQLPFTTALSGAIRAVFAVLKENSDSGNSWRSFLGGSADFSPGQLNLWGSASPAVLNGQTWLNGVQVNGTTTARPQTMSVLSVLTTAGVSASTLFGSAGGNNLWRGDIAELIVYTQPLTSLQRKAIEDYLVLKHAPYMGTAGAPEIAPNGGSFVDAVVVSLNTGTPGAVIHYTVNGSDPTESSPAYTAPFEVAATTTVKAQAFRSGMNPSPISSATFTRVGTFSPSDLSGLALWVRTNVRMAPDAAGRLAVWSDRSGRGNDLAQPAVAAQPLVVPGAVNGQPVVRFDGNDDVMPFTTRLDGTIRAVFLVFKEADAAPAWRAVLGDASTTHFAAGQTTLWSALDASPAVLQGETRFNGLAVNGAVANRPKTMTILSLLTTGGVTVDRLFPGLKGDIAEMVIYDQALTADQRKAVEDYLALKYAITPATVAVPTISPSGGTFAGSISVTMSTTTAGAELHYTLDGSDPTASSSFYTGPFDLTQSATVKARGFFPGMYPSLVAAASFTNTADFSPASVAGLALWTQSSVQTVTDAGGHVSVWKDQSGRGNDLKQTAASSQPVLVAGTVNGFPTLHFDGSNDWMQFTTAFSGTIRAVFAVLKEDPETLTNRAVLGYSGNNDFFPGGATLWSSNTSAATRLGQTWLNGVMVDGTTTNRPKAMSVLSVVPTAGATADRLFNSVYWGTYWKGDIAELIIYDQAITSSQRKAVEDYLANKYAAYTATVGAPELTPNGGSFAGSVTVTMTSPTPGAEIRYTLDGKDPMDPTASPTRYTVPFTLSSTATVRAQAFRTGMNPSRVTAATFLESATFSPSSV